MYNKCELECLTKRRPIPNSIFDKFQTLSEYDWKQT